MSRQNIKKIVESIIIASIVMTSCLSLTACLPAKEYGKFYSLQEAYDNGLLTKEDLKNIAYYNNGYAEEDFNPVPIEPEKLSKETENKIKQTWAFEIRRRSSNPGLYTSAKKYAVNYMGSYNGVIAVIITDKTNTLSLDVSYDKFIDGVKFTIIDCDEISIWEPIQ